MAPPVPLRPMPRPFLTVTVRDSSLDPGLLAMCAGWDRGEWQFEELARHLFEWLPDFAFTDTELAEFLPVTSAEFLSRAARAVYDSDRYAHRGEFGELLLHAIMRQEFKSEPAIAKVYFKDTPNATVHGFDAVHVVADNSGDLELWLGEVKFYGDVSHAMTAVARELREHTEADWLRREFLAVSNKIDPAMPYAEPLHDLIHRTRRIDDIFTRMRIPVLVTYDSPTAAARGARRPVHRADHQRGPRPAAAIRTPTSTSASHYPFVARATS